MKDGQNKKTMEFHGSNCNLKIKKGKNKAAPIGATPL